MEVPVYLQIIGAYLILVNITTFIVYGIDKRKARKSKWRIPEATLIMLAAIGGSPAALSAMKHFHHKTKHKKFTIGVPAILIAQIALVVYILFYR